MTPVPPEQVERFMAEIRPAAEAVCPHFGRSPDVCIQAAAEQSSWGRFVMGFNWWGLAGSGDAGYYQLVRPHRTGQRAGGGFAAEIERIALFKSPSAAVEAWCRSTWAS